MKKINNAVEFLMFSVLLIALGVTIGKAAFSAGGAIWNEAIYKDGIGIPEPEQLESF